jgi:hypothetical protein
MCFIAEHIRDLPFADKVDPEGDRNTDTQRDIGKTANPVTPAFLFLKGDGNDGEEDEGGEPSEGNPETQVNRSIISARRIRVPSDALTRDRTRRGRAR